MFKRHLPVVAAAVGCLVLSACSGVPGSATDGHGPVGTPTPATPSGARTPPAPSSSVPLPTRGAAGAIPDTARLRQLVLQPGEADGVQGPGAGVHDMHPSELDGDAGAEVGPAPCRTMWALLNQRGAQAAVTQTFGSVPPGNPQVTFLASHAGTGATTAFGQLRAALAACPPHASDGRKATVRYEDLDAAGFPEDTLRIRITVQDEGSDQPADVFDRIVARVGVCIVDMVGMGPEPQPRLAEQPVLRQIQRVRAAQGL
ncbi:hypothetical protein [Streptomyces sp. NPDC048603]|uniref:hypothetical protein n=1 Tax=Streptomyces sp. NPDC048603 TaxID=3365577 RepID=UPI00371AC2F5